MTDMIAPMSETAKAAGIRNEYERFGVQAYYEQAGAAYRNPHETIIGELLQQLVPAWQLELAHVLDLACGSGEVTLALRGLGSTQITGVDPFTGPAYQERTGQTALALSFADLAAGALSGQRYSLIVCSFALHLCEMSRLPALCLRLAELAPALLILTPHKRPDLKREWGWELTNETLHERVRARFYQRT